MGTAPVPLVDHVGSSMAGGAEAAVTAGAGRWHRADGALTARWHGRARGSGGLDDAVPAGPLGLVEGLVGAVEEGAEAVVARAHDGGADARRDRQRPGRGLHRAGGDGGPQALAEPCRVPLVPADHQRELLAAVAAKHGPRRSPAPSRLATSRMTSSPTP